MAKEIIITHHNVNDFATALDMIRKAQRDLYYVANTTLIDLYWNLGKHISDRITEAGWGKGTVNELAKYIGENEPNVSGFSASNLWRMRQFYETYSENEKLAPLVREIGWSNNLIILSRCKSYAFELKTEEFKPEHLGKLNFYLEALDRDVKYENENPSIGILLCTSKDDEVVEYAMSRSLSPTLVAQYELLLPDKKLLQQRVREIYEESLDLIERDTDDDKID